jgi:predicted MFS family arabinose efflux permease
VAAKTQVFVVLWYQYGGLSDADAGAVAALAGLGGLLGNVLGGVVGDWAHRQR